MYHCHASFTIDLWKHLWMLHSSFAVRIVIPITLVCVLVHSHNLTCFSSFQNDLVVSASSDKTIRAWIPSTRGDSTVHQGHSSVVQDVKFSNDGKRLITASHDKTVKVWEVPGIKFQCTLSGHCNWVRSASFSPDDQRAISCGDDKVVIMWDISKRVALATLHEHSAPVNCATFHPDGYSIAACSDDGSIKLWDARSHHLIQHYCAHDAPVRSISFHPEGNFLLSGGDDSAIKIWDLREGRLIYTVHGHRGGIRTVSFNKDGTKFATGGTDSFAMAWESNLKTHDVPRSSGTVKGGITTTLSSLPPPPNSVLHSNDLQITGSTIHPPSPREKNNSVPTTTNDDNADLTPDRDGLINNSGEKTRPTNGIPDNLENTLSQIMGSLNMITSALSAIDQRLRDAEDQIYVLRTDKN